MPLLEQGLSKLGLNVPQRKVAEPGFKTDDFTDGFLIEEYQAGKKFGQIILKGPFMPHQPFSFGGEQRLVTEYYPGNSEPSVQVMGPQEKDITIKGELKLKKFKRQYKTIRASGVNGPNTLEQVEAAVRDIAREYQELIDAMRIRGNLVHLVLGEWHRWGFIKSVHFEFGILAEIKYEIDFMIVGFNPPLNTKLAQSPDTSLIAPNTALTDAALGAINDMQQFPTSMPQTIADLLNGEISKVAAAIGLVTGFVNEALKDAENLTASANRAIGLIKNARSVISVSARRINAISTTVASMGSSVASEWAKTTGTIKNVQHLHKMRESYAGFAALLATMAARYKGLSATVPEFRYSVRNGDTLQKIAIKFYNNADLWETIYKHNKLTSTDLAVGSILQIPKV